MIFRNKTILAHQVARIDHDGLFGPRARTLSLLAGNSLHHNVRHEKKTSE